MIILKSLVITTLISALIAVGLRNLTGFWEAFCLAWATQAVAYFIYSSWKISREEQLSDAFQSEIEELLDMSMVDVECPCGKNKFETAIFPTIDNIFDCEVCGSKFKSDISITPTLLTEPVNSAVGSMLEKKEL